MLILYREQVPAQQGSGDAAYYYERVPLGCGSSFDDGGGIGEGHSIQVRPLNNFDEIVIAQLVTLIC